VELYDVDTENNVETLLTGYCGEVSAGIRDLKLSPCFECHMLSSRLFHSVFNLNANVLEHSVCSIFIGEYLLTYEDGTHRVFETLAFKLQMLGNNPEECI
jgi:hypothetical protein